METCGKLKTKETTQCDFFYLGLLYTISNTSYYVNRFHFVDDSNIDTLFKKHIEENVLSTKTA